MSTRIGLEDVRQAQERLRGLFRPTPLQDNLSFSQMTGSEVWLKLENLQRTGSFKVRGAFNKILALSPEEAARGVIAASAGNHAQAVALAASRANIPSTIVMPVGAPLTKVQATRSYGGEVVLSGQIFDDALAHAKALEAERGLTLIHAFDDPLVIAGQGTIGLEIAEELPDLDAVIVPIGGGGLIAGIAIAVKAVLPRAKVIGVQAAGAPPVFLAKQHGHPVHVESVRTIADGIAVKRPGQITFPYIMELVDEVVTVEEQEIAEAIMLLLERSKMMVEGAGAVGIAALLAGRLPQLVGKRVAVVVSGGNIDVNLLSRIIERGLVRAGRYVRLATIVADRPGGLVGLLSTVAQQGANVISVHHDRWLSRSTVGEVEIHLALETRDREHIQALVQALVAAGYAPRLLENEA